MKYWYLLLIAYCVPIHATVCDDMDLLEKTILLDAAKGEIGVAKSVQSLAVDMQACGTPAIELMKNLLASPAAKKDKSLINLVGYIARDFPGFTVRDLPWLIQLYELDGDEDGGWVAPAIASIEDVQAIQFVMGKVLQLDSLGNQVGTALERLGSKSLPYLVREFDCKNYCDEKRLMRVVNAFHELDGDAVPAAEKVAAFVLDKNENLLVRKHALMSIGSMGVPVPSVAGRLVKLLPDVPEDLQGALTFALVNLKHPQAGELLARQLTDKNGFWGTLVLRDIAALSSSGYGGGPEIVKLIHASDDWEMRVAAAQTLGFIGYNPAVPELITASKNTKDWRLVYSAVESLGRLKASLALAQLDSLTENHWYPPVRELASVTARVIRAKPSQAALAQEKDIRELFNQYTRVPVEENDCDHVASPFVPENALEKYYRPDLELDKLEFEYSAEIKVTYTDGIEAPENIEMRTPDVALKVEGGWLAASDGGEFGGALLWFDNSGKYSAVLRENIQNIFHLRTGYFALANISTMITDDSVIYRVMKNAQGEWQADAYIALPGYVERSSLLDSGELFISTSRGDVIFSPEGELRMAECVN